MKIATIGLDLTKNVFHVHGVDEHGAMVLRKQLRRQEVNAFFARLEPCLVGKHAHGDPDAGHSHLTGGPAAGPRRHTHAYVIDDERRNRSWPK